MPVSVSREVLGRFHAEARHKKWRKCASVGYTSQGRRVENHSAGKFGEELQSSLLRIAHDSRQVIVAVEFTWLRMIRQASDS